MDGPAIDDLLSWRSKVRQHTVETRSEALPQQAVDLMLEMAAEINSLKLALAGLEQRVSAVERVEIVHGVNIRGAA